MENRGIQISRNKTNYLLVTDEGREQGTNENARDVIPDGQPMERVRKYRCLRSTVAEERNEDLEVNRRIQEGWKN